VTTGLLCMVISSYSYAFASTMSSGTAFYAISYVSRLFQGIADAQICVALFSITSIEFNANTVSAPAKYMGYMQGSLGLGMLLGPVVSSLVYPLFSPLCKICGYAYTFIFYGSVILIFGVGSACALPSSLNKSKNKDPLLIIPYSMFFKNKLCAMSLFTLVYAQVCMNYMVPSLAVTEITYGMSKATSGLGFALIALVAGAGAPIWGGKTEKWDMRYICLFGLCC